MKYIIILSFLCLSSFGQVTRNFMVQPVIQQGNGGNEVNIYTDDFEARSTGDLAGQGNWINILANTIMVYDVYEDHQVGAYPIVYEECAVGRSEDYSDNQYSQLTIENVVSGEWIGPAIQCWSNGDDQFDFIFWVSSSTASFCAHRTESGMTTIASGGAPFQTGDVIRIECEDITIRFYRNGILDVTIGSDGESTYSDMPTGGTPGIAGRNWNGTKADDWEGGDL